MELETRRVLIQRFSPTFSQVGINIIEAQKLVGVNINPFVVVKVGEEKRHTATQKSTNCPFYNEVCDTDRGSVLALPMSQVAEAILAGDARGAAALRQRRLWDHVGSLGLSCLALLFQYFLFEFHEPRDVLFHRLIEISVRMSSLSFVDNWYSPTLLRVDAGSDGQSQGTSTSQVFQLEASAPQRDQRAFLWPWWGRDPAPL